MSNKDSKQIFPYGIDNDGWSRKNSLILVPNTNSPGTVSFELEIPGWLTDQIDLRVIVNGKLQEHFDIYPGYYQLMIRLNGDISANEIEFLCEDEYQLPGQNRFASFRISLEARIEPSSNEEGIFLEPIEAWGSHEEKKQPFAFESSVLQTLKRVTSSFEVKESTDGAGTIFWHGKKVGQTRSLAELKDAYDGDCFVLASGPSIANIDFNLLKGRTMFAVNGAISLQNDFQIDIPLYIAVDKRFVANRFNMIKKAVLSGARCLLNLTALKVICLMEPKILKQANIYLLNGYEKPQGVPENFFDLASNLERGYTDGGMVTFLALQACYFMGFNRVFILGMDMNTLNNKVRFYETEDQANYGYGILHEMDMNYESILRKFNMLGELIRDDENNFIVYNLSRNSRLPDSAIPKMTLEKALKI